VPEFHGRVSAVFDWAQALVVVDHDGQVEQARHQESLARLAPALRPGQLAMLEIETLLCGGISQTLAAMVQARGVGVMPGLAGEVDAVLAAFFAGRLPDPRFAMPGWAFVPPPIQPCTRGRFRRRCGRSPGTGRRRG
jgi:predicted Fe-Mo cluster-binding NifX family protein